MVEREALPDGLRAQLLSLGIPAAQHTADGLVGLFPREINIGAAGLKAADLGEAFVHFATHGGVAVGGPKSAVSVRKVEPGWHFCRFYRDFEQYLDMIAPYIAEGLKNGEACVWVPPTGLPDEDAREALARQVGDPAPYFADGQLELISRTDWYMHPEGRLRSFEEIRDALVLKQNQALARGFRLLRAAGDAGWSSGTEQAKSFIDYEMKVDAVIGATRIAAVCTFRADVTSKELIDILRAHQDAHEAISG